MGPPVSTWSDCVTNWVPDGRVTSSGPGAPVTLKGWIWICRLDSFVCAPPLSGVIVKPVDVGVTWIELAATTDEAPV